jgi:hypothetical protein
MQRNPKTKTLSCLTQPVSSEPQRTACCLPVDQRPRPAQLTQQRGDLLLLLLLLLVAFQLLQLYVLLPPLPLLLLII